MQLTDLIEEVLELLIGKVDAPLLKAVLRKVLKSEDVQNACHAQGLQHANGKRQCSIDRRKEIVCGNDKGNKAHYESQKSISLNNEIPQHGDKDPEQYLRADFLMLGSPGRTETVAVGIVLVKRWCEQLVDLHHNPAEQPPVQRLGHRISAICAPCRSQDSEKDGWETIDKLSRPSSNGQPTQPRQALNEECRKKKTVTCGERKPTAGLVESVGSADGLAARDGDTAEQGGLEAGRRHLQQPCPGCHRTPLRPQRRRLPVSLHARCQDDNGFV